MTEELKIAGAQSPFVDAIDPVFASLGVWQTQNSKRQPDPGNGGLNYLARIATELYKKESLLSRVVIGLEH